MIKTKKIADEKVNLIMQNYNVENAINNGTITELNVDYLKQFEKYRTNGRAERKLNNKTPSLFGYYYNDLTKTELQDDCSSFVSAVINLFVQENKQIKNKFDKYKHYTSAKLLNNINSENELIAKGFDCYKSNPNENERDIIDSVPLIPGDILVRKNHVEIYLGDNWSFGWGEVHNSYENNPDSKNFKWHFGTEDEVKNSNNSVGYYFYNINKPSESEYIKVYRYNGE